MNTKRFKNMEICKKGPVATEVTARLASGIEMRVAV